MQSMLQTAQDNIRSAQERARNYAEKSRRDITFDEGDLAYLKVLVQLKALKMRKCQKLSLTYCGLFKILNKIGDVAYKIKFLDGIKAYPVFHVSKLKRMLHSLENIVSPNVLVELIKPPSAPHEPQKMCIQTHMLSLYHLSFTVVSMDFTKYAYRPYARK